MISGEMPWRRAQNDDSVYRDFRRWRTFSGHPVSTEAETLLLRIFTQDPTRRISLARLREEVVKIKTFFTELECPEEFEEITPAPVAAPEVKSPAQQSSPTDAGVFVVGSLPSSSPETSESESDGPTTPETFPRHLVAMVSDLVDDEDFDLKYQPDIPEPFPSHLVAMVSDLVDDEDFDLDCQPDTSEPFPSHLVEMVSKLVDNNELDFDCMPSNVLQRQALFGLDLL